MRCIFCKNRETEVIETRMAEDGSSVRRRRECVHCRMRFTTHERNEELPILVIKRDGRRERYDREKLQLGILKAVEKTGVSASQVEKIIEDVESLAARSENGEMESQHIGDLVANRLKKFDKIAYIRFASVFRRFLDVEELQDELHKL